VPAGLFCSKRFCSCSFWAAALLFLAVLLLFLAAACRREAALQGEERAGARAGAQEVRGARTGSWRRSGGA
jgi:hypothetical protein